MTQLKLGLEPMTRNERRLLAGIFSASCALMLLLAYTLTAYINVGGDVGSARPVKIVGTADESTGEYLVLRVTPRTLQDVITGNADGHRAELSDWHAAAADVRFEDNDAVRATDDAWAAASSVAAETWLPSRRFSLDLTSFAPYLSVELVERHGPADKAGLRGNERITAINGIEATMENYSAKVVAGEAGFPVSLTVTDDSSAREVLVTGLPADDGTFSVGLYVAEHLAVLADHPRPLIPEGETGRSSGLVHGLSLVDAVTSGDLTNGRRVAATGTLSFRGKVGAISGMTGKTEAAIAAGADVLLVPIGNAQEAIASANGRIAVIPVGTLAQSVAALCRLGGSSTACTSAAAASYGILSPEDEQN